MQKSKLDEYASLVHELAICSVSSNACNQYSYEHPSNAVRRNNLNLYLHQMANRGPRTLLVGEAAGYLGCKLTGVPFTSEEILLRGIAEFGLFGESRGYHITSDSTQPCKETTATIVWSVLKQAERLPLLWNTYPFHPFRAGKPFSNRTPNDSELTIGRPFLLTIISLFDIHTVVAVGKKSDSVLDSMGVTHHSVRHPSHGGKEEFASGVMHIIQRGV